MEKSQFFKKNLVRVITKLPKVIIVLGDIYIIKLLYSEIWAYELLPLNIPAWGGGGGQVCGISHFTAALSKLAS